jgi:predicted deacylase
MTISIGDVDVQSGEKVTGTLSTAETRDGSPIEHPVHVLNGVDDGPTAWIQAAIHGNEYVGSVAILEAWQELHPADVAGAVVFLPALNVTAFRQGTRGSPHEYKYQLDMNRVFPGDPQGKFTQFVADRIFDEFVDTADSLLDFHTGSHPDTRWALYSDVGPVGDEAARLGRALGFPFLLKTTETGQALPLDRSMFIQGAREGIPGIIVESGSKGTVDDPERRDAKRALYNYLDALDVIDGQNEPIADDTVELSDWTVPTASRGGRLFCDATPGDSFTEGDRLGWIESFDGDVVEEFDAPFDGYVLMSNETPFAASGDDIFQLGRM